MIVDELKDATNCRYGGHSILYYPNEDGSLHVRQIAEADAHMVVISASALEFYKTHRYAADDKLVLRDVGCQLTCVYTDDFSLYVPTEILK